MTYISRQQEQHLGQFWAIYSSIVLVDMYAQFKAHFVLSMVGLITWRRIYVLQSAYKKLGHCDLLFVDNISSTFDQFWAISSILVARLHSLRHSFVLVWWLLLLWGPFIFTQKSRSLWPIFQTTGAMQFGPILGHFHQIWWHVCSV